METSLIGWLHVTAALRKLMPFDRSIGQVYPAPQALSFGKKTLVLAGVLVGQR